MPFDRFDFSNESPGFLPEDISNENIYSPEARLENEQDAESESTEPLDSFENETPASLEARMLEGVLRERGGTPSDWRRGENWREDYFDGKELFKDDRETSITKELEDAALKAGTTEWLEDHHLFLQHLSDRPGEIFTFPDFTDENGITHVYVALSDGHRVVYGEYEYVLKIEEAEEIDLEIPLEEADEEVFISEVLEETREQVTQVEVSEMLVRVNASEAASVEGKNEEKAVVPVLAVETSRTVVDEVVRNEVKAPVSVEMPLAIATDTEFAEQTEETEDEAVFSPVEQQEDMVLSIHEEEAIREPVSVEILNPVPPSGIRLVEAGFIPQIPELGTEVQEQTQEREEVVSEMAEPITHTREEEAVPQESTIIQEVQVEHIEVQATQKESIEASRVGFSTQMIEKEVQEVDKADAKEIAKEEPKENPISEAANDNEKVEESVSERDQNVVSRVTERKESLTEALEALFAEEQPEIAPVESRNTEHAIEALLTDEVLRSEPVASRDLSPELAFMTGAAFAIRSFSPVPTSDTVSDSRQGPRRVSTSKGITLLAA